MAISFPLSPNSGDEFTSGSRTWIWNGSVWVLNSDTFSTPFIPELDDINDVVITPPTYAIGDTGPAGGKIFITPSTAGNTTGKYFEASPVNAEAIRTWSSIGNQTTLVTGADGTAIGTGYQNTLDIVAQPDNVEVSCAAVYCSVYTYGGFSDWFLPSLDELAELYTNRVIVGDFSSVYYWSSSEFDADNARFQSFNDGTQEPSLKDNQPFVRPVRSFNTGTTAGNGEILEFDGTNWVNAPAPTSSTPKIYVEKFTDYNDNQWTCPAGVTQIKLTLIGAGGACGDVEAITAFSSTSASFSGDTAGETTFVVSEFEIYTVLGGKKGGNVSVTGDIFEMSVAIGSASGSSGVDDADYNRYPGCGGAPSTASAYTQRTWLDGDVYALHRSRAYAHGKRGQDGVTQVFQVTVVPSTVYSFTVGEAAGYDGITTYSTQGSNGAVIIEYVV